MVCLCSGGDGSGSDSLALKFLCGNERKKFIIFSSVPALKLPGIAKLGGFLQRPGRLATSLAGRWSMQRACQCQWRLSRVVDDDDGSWRTYVSEDCSSYLRQGLATERLGAQRNGEMCVCVCLYILTHNFFE